MGWMSLLITPVLLLCVGCAISPGRSPSQIEAAYSSAGWMDRDYAPMQAEIP